ncbi:Alpha/Beta hydrolase protein [Xylogone sp. PMI_703]|nr:Alpha/Beta hydrolase protein [Xylogone sp. PMI_703]
MANVSKAISADFPFSKRKIEVLGSNMAFVDVGTSKSTVTVFLHGNPTSSYLWRNIIPYAAKWNRCIAPDLIGFGDSDKVSSLTYRVMDHQRYLDAFLDIVLPTEKVILIVHDWGSALGFDWARRHEDRVAGLVFMEFLPPTDNWSEFPEEFIHNFQQFRNPEIGRTLLIDQNLFIERILPNGIVRPLGEEMDHYRKPFVSPESREPVYRFPNELPIAYQPLDVWSMAEKYMAWLLASDHPKLFFWVTPGIFINKSRAEKLIQQLHNTRNVYLGEGFHFVQEDYPHEIGREISDWLATCFEGL